MRHQQIYGLPVISARNWRYRGIPAGFTKRLLTKMLSVEVRLGRHPGFIGNAVVKRILTCQSATLCHFPALRYRAAGIQGGKRYGRDYARQTGQRGGESCQTCSGASANKQVNAPARQFKWCQQCARSMSDEPESATDACKAGHGQRRLPRKLRHFRMPVCNVCHLLKRVRERVQPLRECVQQAAVLSHHPLQVLPFLVKVDCFAVVSAADRTISIIQAARDSVGINAVMNGLKLFVDETEHLAAGTPEYQGVLTLLLFFGVMVPAVEWQDDVFIVFDRRLAEELRVDKWIAPETLHAAQAVEFNLAGIPDAHRHQVVRDLIRQLHNPV